MKANADSMPLFSRLSLLSRQKKISLLEEKCAVTARGGLYGNPETRSTTPDYQSIPWRPGLRRGNQFTSIHLRKAAIAWPAARLLASVREVASEHLPQVAD